MRLSITLTIVIAVAYYGLQLLGAFDGSLLARPVYGAIPMSFLLGFLFIVGSVLLTALYAWIANLSEPRA